VAALRPGPLIDAPRATLALLQGYDDRAVVALQGPPRAESLTVPLDLPGAPWDLTPLQVRRSRPIRLPPGAYRLEVSGQVLSGFGLGGSARLEVLGARAAVDDTEPNPAIALDLPRGTRRLVVEARGLRGRVRVTRVIVRPVRLLTRRERASAAAP
jgi:hypothetical protein